MRRFAVLLLVATNLATAPAAAAGLFEQYAAARSLYVVDPSDSAKFQTTYAKELMKGLDGTWFPIGLLEMGNPTGLSPDVYAIACERNGQFFTVVDDFTMTSVRAPGTDKAITTTYVARGGTSFGVSADSGELMRNFGLDKVEDFDPIAAFNVINSQNGVATILRPSPDILIIEINAKPPFILGRCPA